MSIRSRGAVSVLVAIVAGLTILMRSGDVPLAAREQSQAQSPTPTPPPLFNVNVTNTPLPVTGAVTATLSGTPTVNAVITGLPAVQLQDPYQQAYQDSFNFTADYVGRCGPNQEKINVPVGKILLIQNVFVSGRVSKGERVLGVLQVKFVNPQGVTLDSVAGFDFAPSFAAAEPPSVRYPAGRDVFSGNFPATIVAQAGDSVFVDGCTEGPEGAGNSQVQVVVTGRFVDMP